MISWSLDITFPLEITQKMIIWLLFGSRFGFFAQFCPRLELISSSEGNEVVCTLLIGLLRISCSAGERGRGAERRRGKVRCVEVFKKRKWLGAVGARARVALNFTWSTFNLRRTKPCRHGRALLYYIDGGFMKLWPSGTCTPCNQRFYLLVWSLIFHQRFFW